MARAARLLAAGILYQGVDLDDIGAPVGELAHAGRPGADAGKVEHGETGQGLRGAREGHSWAPMWIRAGSWPQLPKVAAIETPQRATLQPGQEQPLKLGRYCRNQTGRPARGC